MHHLSNTFEKLARFFFWGGGAVALYTYLVCVEYKGGFFCI